MYLYLQIVTLNLGVVFSCVEGRQLWIVVRELILSAVYILLCEVSSDEFSAYLVLTRLLMVNQLMSSSLCGLLRA